MKQLELFRDYLDIKSDFALYKNIKNTNAIEAHKSMRTIIERLTTPIESEVKDTFLIGPYKLGAITRRANQNVVAISALVFDIDNPLGKTFEELTEIASPYAGILHTTWTHTKSEPRFRLFIHLSKQVSALEFNAIRTRFLLLNPDLEKVIDKSCSDIARAYYLFSYPQERAQMAQCFVLMGEPVDPTQYRLPLNNYQDLNYQSKPDEITLDTVVKKGSRNMMLAKLIGGLIATGLNNHETLTKAIEWNGNIEEPLSLDELKKTHKSIWNTHTRNHPSYNQEIEAGKANRLRYFPIVRASTLLASPPPKRDWIIQDFLPNKIVGSIIAAGGTGKSFLAMHIAVSVASGSSLFGKYIPKSPSKVVFISGEDDKEELQRRLHKIAPALPHLMQSVYENLCFIDLADSFELFTEKNTRGEVSITSTPKLICDQIKAELGHEIGLVIIDPISRFRGGEENLAADTTRFVQSLQQIRDQLNTSVLTLHHVNKLANSGGNQNNARGSSAFIDGVRLVYQLSTLSDSDVKNLYGTNASHLKLINLQSVKSNYGKPIDPITLARRDDGSLELFSMVAGDHQRKAILQEIRISKLSKTKFKEIYGNVKGKFGLSEKALLSKLTEFELAGLISTPSRNPMQVTKIGQKLIDG